MIFITVADIEALHGKLIEATGGLAGILDSGLLESAVLSRYQVFGDEELYPGVAERQPGQRLEYARITLSLTGTNGLPYSNACDFASKWHRTDIWAT